MCFKKGELFMKKVGFEVKVVLESSIEHTKDLAYEALPVHRRPEAR